MSKKKKEPIGIDIKQKNIPIAGYYVMYFDNTETPRTLKSELITANLKNKFLDRFGTDLDNPELTLENINKFKKDNK